MNRLVELKQQAKQRRTNRDRLLEQVVEECAELVYEDLKYTSPKLAAYLVVKIKQHFGVEK